MTVNVSISNVYYNQGNIQIQVVAATPFGENANATIAPNVYCCGTQTYIWNNFPFYNCNATFTVTQGGRSATVSGVYIWGDMPWSNPTLVLSTIPNYQHKIEK